MQIANPNNSKVPSLKAIVKLKCDKNDFLLHLENRYYLRYDKSPVSRLDPTKIMKILELLSTGEDIKDV